MEPFRALRSPCAGNRFSGSPLGRAARGSRDSETVVGVFERWWNTRPARGSADLDVVPPGTPSRGTATTVAGPTRISFRRPFVVAGVVPVRTPFMYVVAQIIKAVSVWRVQSHGLRSALPTSGVIRNRLGRRVSPRVQRAFRATPSGAFPLGFGRQAIGLARRTT